MKVKLLRKIRRDFLIKHTTKGTVLCYKDFSNAVLIAETTTWRSALLVRFVISFSYSEKHLKNEATRVNKRIYNSDKYSLNPSIQITNKQ